MLLATISTYPDLSQFDVDQIQYSHYYQGKTMVDVSFYDTQRDDDLTLEFACNNATCFLID